MTETVSRALQDPPRDVFGLLPGAQGGLWEGGASAAFTAYWGQVHGRIGDLARSHDQMAATLDGVAAEASLFNSDAQAAIGGIRAWLESAARAIASMDPGEMARLV